VTYFDQDDNFPADAPEGPNGPAVEGGPGVDAWLGDDVWVRVKSSNVGGIRYDAETKSLFVSFHGGKPGKPESRYRYDNIPEEVARGLYLSPSIGGYLHARVKGRYTHHKEG
jgi:hypothetical protein